MSNDNEHDYVLPLTREDFESVVEAVTKQFDLPFNDETRMAAVSYFHSLERTIFTYDIDTLGAFMHKQLSNKMTYEVSQDIHNRIVAKQQADKEAAAASAKPALSLVDPPSPAMQ